MAAHDGSIVVKRTRRRTLGRREAIVGYLLIGPWIIHFLVFNLGPMVASAYLSFSQYDMMRPPTWVGLANYNRMLFADPDMWYSLKVTAIYSFGSVPLTIVLSMIIAMLLNQRIVGLSYWRTVYFLPSVVSGVAVAMLWSLLFSPQAGLINRTLALVGIQGPSWLGSPDWALPSLILMSLWGVGGGMVLYLAGLQGIPTELYEAAEIDGANAWHRFRNVTIPMMSPVLLFTLVMGVIGSFQVFTQVYVMTGGGPAKATLVYGLHLYRQAFQSLQMGYGSAMAWLLFLVILVLTGLIFRSSPAWVYYEAERKR
jgi:multiple sugar transport system permease protein